MFSKNTDITAGEPIILSPLYLSLLGAFQAAWNNTTIVFDTDKSRALLSYLAMEANRPHQREYLAGLLWSDLPKDRALHSLRQALSALRRSLAESQRCLEYLSIEREIVQFNLTSDIQMDVEVFEREAERAMKHYQPIWQNRQVHSRLNVRRLQHAVSLFRGPFLDQLYLNGSPLFDEWASLKREQLNQLMIRALSVIADLSERRGHISQARQYASQIVSLAPWDETAQTQVIRLLAIEGHWSAAQSQFRHLKHYLHDQLGVDPSKEAVTLYETVRQHAGQNIPLQPLQPPSPHNLPFQATQFFGREKELDSLSEILETPANRLVTISGAGGVGKTRLALEVAHLQLGVFRDGVYYFPLADLPSHELLPIVLADTLGFPISDGKSAVDQVQQFIRGKHMLWLLDNLEHILPLPADNLISNILNLAPGIIMLCTSRQRLNLQEEYLFPIGGLPYPQNADLPIHQHFAAMELFTNRAQRIQRTFELSNFENFQAVVDICQAVEGFPLGLELAATGLWSNSANEIAASLRRSLCALSSNAIDSSRRHRSLQGVFQVSWELLSDSEREVLSHLSVFRGGFESVMVTKWLGSSISLLASLLDKSLLYQEISGRFGMHETIRQFAADKLAENANLESQARQTHAGGFTKFLKARISELKGVDQAQALMDISMEWENIRQAWSWLVFFGQPQAIISCAEAIFHFCNIRTRYQEGIDLFAQATNRPNLSNADLAILLTFQGALAYRAYQNDLSEMALNQALTLFEDLDAKNYQALCLLFSSGMAIRRKKQTLARNLCEQALGIFSLLNDDWGLSYAWYQMGVIENRQGKVEAAKHAVQTSLQAARNIGDLRRQIGPVNMLGDLACQNGDYHLARVYFEESLALSRTLEDQYNIALALGNLGTTYHQIGLLDQARNCYKESLLIAQNSNDLSGEALALVNLGELAVSQSDYVHARVTFQKALDLADNAGDQWLSLICWINLAETSIGLGEFDTAETYLKKSLPMAAQSGEPALILRTFLQYGQAYVLNGHKRKGIDLLGLVLHHEASYDEHRQAALQILQEVGEKVPCKASLTIEAALDILF